MPHFSLGIVKTNYALLCPLKLSVIQYQYSGFQSLLIDCNNKPTSVSFLSWLLYVTLAGDFEMPEKKNPRIIGELYSP